jgi:hypothetical protein
MSHPLYSSAEPTIHQSHQLESSTIVHQLISHKLDDPPTGRLSQPAINHQPMSHQLDGSADNRQPTADQPSTINQSHKLDSSAESSTIVHQIMIDDSTNWTTISRPSTISS